MAERAETVKTTEAMTRTVETPGVLVSNRMGFRITFNEKTFLFGLSLNEARLPNHTYLSQAMAKNAVEILATELREMGLDGAAP